MRKAIIFGLILALSLGIVGCNGLTTAAPTTAATTAATTTAAQTTEMTTTEDTAMTTTEGTTTMDTVAPVLSGVEDVTIYLDDTFVPLEGITAIDNVDGDITSSIEYSGSVDTSKADTYFTKYTVEDAAGNKTEATRYVTVEIDPSLIGDEMIQNGDFSLGAGIWTLALNEGGVGEFQVVQEGENNVGAVVITAAGWSKPFPRLDSNVTEFENGKTYEVSFKAKAALPRPVFVQVGQLLNTGPWFVDYNVGQTEIFDLTTDWQTFTFKFVMNEEVDAGTMLEGQLLFAHGSAYVGEVEVPAANYNTTVYYDDVTIVETTPDPDTTAPEFSGIVDVTLQTGSTFDALDGVTAFDIVDGNVTEDITVTGTVDLETAGVYTLTYEVEDAAGNVASETRDITVVDLVFNDTGEVVDPSFDTTTTIIDEVQDENNGYADITGADVWYKYIAGWDGAAATVSVIDNAAVLDITALGNENFGVILKQKGIALMTGETYKLSFTASATADRDMEAKVTDDYFSSFNLTSTPTEFSFVFTVTGASTDMARIMFMLGNTPNAAIGTVTIDDVMVSVLDQPELLMNSDFSDFGWGIYSHDNASTLATVDGKLVATVASVGSNPYDVQVFQNDVDLEEGVTYTLTFDAMADVARDINFKIMTPGYVVEAVNTFSLTTTMTEYTFQFTYNSTVDLAQINIELGNISGATAGVVTFDNFVISDGTDNVVVNSTFDQPLGWGAYSHDNATTIANVGGELVATVASVGSNPYDVQLFYNDVALVQGNTYTIIFEAKADVARDINYKLMTPGYTVRDTQVISLTTDMQLFTSTFTYEGTDPLGQINFELGNIGTAGAGTITFDNIYFFRNLNPQTSE